MASPHGNLGVNLWSREIESFLSDLKSLSCGPRKDGETRELQLIRKELAERDARIHRLEHTLQRREEAREGRTRIQ